MSFHSVLSYLSDVLLWTPTYGRAKAGRPARTYIQQLCEDTGCNPEDLPGVMNDREKWRERVRDIHVGGTTWWWLSYLILKIYYDIALQFCTLSTENFMNYKTLLALNFNPNYVYALSTCAV